MTKEERSPHSVPPLVPQPLPWLVISHGKHNQKQTFFSISENRYYPKVIPEIRNKYIWTLSYGWFLLMDHDSKDAFLWNPISMEKLQLPPVEWPSNETYGICIVTSPPFDPNCRVIFINGFLKKLMFCRPGDLEFVKQEFELCDDVLERVTTFEGKIYGVTRPGYLLVTAEFVGPALQFRQFLREGLPSSSIRPDKKDAHCHLVDCCGELLVVRMILVYGNNEPADFELFQLDISEKKCTKVESLGQRAIFLETYRSTGTSTGCSVVEAGIRGNCIYYVQREDASLYKYDLEEQSISISLPCPHVHRRWSLLRWIWFM